VTSISEPTVFNLGAWTNAGQQENYMPYGFLNSVNPIKNGNNIMNHVAEIIEGPCDIGLRAIPWVDFWYYNDHDALFVDFDAFKGTPSHKNP
jgi:hypothetical protein